MLEKRPQTEKLESLVSEFKKLKHEIFGDHSFVVMEKSAKAKKMARRYDQLFQFFNPSFRTKAYVSPL